MIRAFLAAIGVAVVVLVALLVVSGLVSVPGMAAGLHPRCNIDWPCQAAVQPSSKSHTSRATAVMPRRADRFRNVELGSPMYPPETQRSFLAKGGDSKPRAWCGWWMRHYLGVKNPAGNLARWWAGYGAKASGPAVGTIVVWARGRRSGHVGIITGQAGNGQWVVKSGNDGNAVRERVRSVSGAIAFRWPA